MGSPLLNCPESATLPYLELRGNLTPLFITEEFIASFILMYALLVLFPTSYSQENVSKAPIGYSGTPPFV
jgi:hypothetical protein